jgi:hypothetical protein
MTRPPYVGEGADGARRSAQIDREEADLLDESRYAARERLLTSADQWLEQAGAADERARIVWWLRAGLSGPAGVNLMPSEHALVAELADVIEQHPERFADAPTRTS